MLGVGILLASGVLGGVVWFAESFFEPTLEDIHQAVVAGREEEAIRAIRRHPELIHSGDLVQRIVMRAVMDYQHGVLEAMLDAGYNPNTLISGDMRWYDACMITLDKRTSGGAHYNWTAFDLFLDHGADPNISLPGRHFFPLWWAANERRFDMIIRLVDAGADLKGDDAYWAMETCATDPRGHDALKAMLEAGADPNQPSRTNHYLLGPASGEGYPAAVTLLLEYGADPNKDRNEYGYPVNWALGQFRCLKPTDTEKREKLAEIIQLLIDAGARPSESRVCYEYAEAIEEADTERVDLINSILRRDDVIFEDTWATDRR
ncbi:MAG: hypothetical protein R3C01_06520 [Planctomycetaceae bacterium]